MAISNETVVYTLLGRDQLSKTFQGVQKNAALLAGGVLAAGAALVKIGSDFDKAYDTIRVGTGATGKTLDGLKSDFKNVVKDVPADFGTASKAVADLNTRTGLSGKPLQVMSKQFLELSRITGTDVSQNVASVTRVFGDWSIKTGDQSKALDSLFRASQSTGIGVDELATQIVQFGAPLRQLGFGFEESAALMGKWEKEGVNSGLVLAGLKQGLGNFAKAGEAPAEALQAVIEKIKGAGSTAEANKIAIQTFGKRAGPDMAAAVREGRFELEDLLKTVKGGGETILDAAEDTKSFGEKLLELKNKVFVALEPVAIAVFDGIGAAIDGVGAAVGFLKSTWEGMPQWMQFGVTAWAGVTVALLAAKPVFGAMKTAILAIKGAAETAYLKLALMSRGMKMVTLSMGGIGILFAAAATAIELFGGESAEAKQRQEELAVAGKSVAEVIREQNGVINDAVVKKAAEAAENAGLLSGLKNLGFEYGTVTDAILGQGQAYDQIRAKLLEEIAILERRQNVKGGGGQAVRQEKEALERLLGSLDGVVGGKNRELEATKRQDEATEQATKGRKDNTKATKDGTEAIEEHINKLRAATDPVFALVDALDSVDDAQRDYNKAVKDHGKNSRQAKEASIGLAKAVAGAEAAAISGDLNFKDFRKTLKRWVDQGVITADQAKTIEKRVKEAREEAQDFKGNYPVTFSTNANKTRDSITSLRKHWNKELSKFNNKTVSFEVAMRRPPELRYPGMASNADGNVYERHDAQIAPGGAWRLWAEPETGGEAYIPLATSKRSRSMAILEEVARRFGAQLMPKADGGITRDVNTKFSVSGFSETIQAIKANLFTVQQAIAASLSGMFGGPTSPGLNGALTFARSQAGKPYIWGGVGPGGYDCSGFMSALVNVALGRSPYGRLGSTATFPWGMFAPGAGAFSIGSFRGNPGHMAGTVNGVNVESRGGDGVVVGPSARGARSGMFTTLAHLKGFAQGGIVGDAPFDLIDPRGKYTLRTASFDQGGYLQPGYTLAHNGTGRPEAVGPAGITVHVNVGGVVGMTKQDLQNELVKALVSLDKQSRLPR